MEKFTSRKFIAMLTGVLTGIGVLLGGNIYEGVVTVLVSVVTYLAAEGVIDASSVSQAHKEQAAQQLMREEE